MSIVATVAGDLSLRGVSRRFRLDGGASVEALRGIDLDLDIPGGGIVSIVGASGCGKSTLLRVIAGLDTAYEGRVELGGRPIRQPGLDRGVVFQEHRLLPWLNVRRNIAFGLVGLSEAEVGARVDEHLELVGLRGFGEALPHELSGGMAQRVAIARALVNRPQILLLDEPFGALDAFTRIQLQQEILRIWEIERTTMILVTHDIDEAVFLGDRVLVMSARPGTLRSRLEVPLPRPRDRSSHEFIAIRRRLYDEFFSDGAANAAAADTSPAHNVR